MFRYRTRFVRVRSGQGVGLSPLYFSKARPTPLTWRVREENKATWIDLQGAVDLFSFRAFDKMLDEICQGEGKKVVLNCAELRYLNSRGIASIYRHHHTCREAKGRLILCAPTGRIAENLRMMGLDGVLEIVPDAGAIEPNGGGEERQ